jgi:preprotein translocase subunit SecG
VVCKPYGIIIIKKIGLPLFAKKRVAIAVVLVLGVLFSENRLNAFSDIFSGSANQYSHNKNNGFERSS